MMNSNQIASCDCCGLPQSLQQGELCVSCGYPVKRDREIAFLEQALIDLNRVAQHGGAYTTVANLIRRYQERLQKLYTAPVPQPIPAEKTITPHRVELPQSQPVYSHSNAGAFSFKAFFADQTINVVALLGAFLILVGSLSFIITTKDLLLSFLTLLCVHILFGGIGIIAKRFPSLRTVSSIYTTIFALQVPLVAYSAFRLASGSQFPLSTSTIVTLGALYAAITYAMLALYQQFKPFGYLAMAALVVTILALCQTLTINFWWWGNTLLLLALLLLFVVPTNKQQWQALVVWYEPAQLFMYLCVAASLFLIAVFVLAGNTLFIGLPHWRWSLTAMLGLLLLWLSGSLLRYKLYQMSLLIPYLFIAWIFAICYALFSSTIVYAVTMTAVAAFYHVLTRLPGRWQHAIQYMRLHLDILVVLLMFSVPLAVFTILPILVFLNVYLSPNGFLFSNPNIWILFSLLVISVLLFLSTMFAHTGWKKQVAKNEALWCWLLVLVGLHIHYIAIMAILEWRLVPAWSLAACAILCALAAATLRRWYDGVWSRPLEVVALFLGIESVLLSFRFTDESFIVLLLGIAAFTYGLLLYQRRFGLLLLPIIWCFVALTRLINLPLWLLVLSIVLPLLAVGIRWLMNVRRLTTEQLTRHPLNDTWEWPLLLVAFAYSLALIFVTYNAATSLLFSAFPYAFDVAVIAGIWCVAAVSARRKTWMIGVVVFATIALLLFPHAFWYLLLSVLCFIGIGFCLSRWVSSAWSVSFYALGFLTVLVLARGELSLGHTLQLFWTLLALSLVLYFVSVWERQALLRACVRWGVFIALLYIICHGLSLTYMSKFIDSLMGHTVALGILLFALLLGWQGRSHPSYAWRKGSWYIAGFLCTLIVSWELCVWHLGRLETLWIVPATYLIVLSPLFTRDELFPSHLRWSQRCAVLGTFVLFMPMLWLSFSEQNIQPTLLLAAEAFFLLLLGLVLQTRVFTLSGVAIIIVSALHLLFLPSLGIPTFLALTLAGLFLLVLATILLLVRTRLSILWSGLK